MKDIFYLFHNNVQLTLSTIDDLFRLIKSKFDSLVENYTYWVTLFYPLLLFYLLFKSTNEFFIPSVSIFIALGISLFFVIIISIPSYYFIKGENLFDFKKNIEIIQIEKPKKKKYKQLDSVQLSELKLLFSKDARNYFNCAEYNFETFKNLINNIVESDFESKILLNEEVKVKDFVAFIHQLVKITRFNLIDLCKNYKFYISGEYIDLNYGTVKTELRNFRKLTKEKINQ